MEENRFIYNKNLQLYNRLVKIESTNRLQPNKSFDCVEAEQRGLTDRDAEDTKVVYTGFVYGLSKLPEI